MKFWKIDRIISLATLSVSILALALVLKRPQPVTPVMAPTAVAANAQSFNDKLQQFQQARADGQQDVEMRLNGPEITAAIAQAAGALPVGGGGQTGESSAQAKSGGVTPASSAGSGGNMLSGDLGPGDPNIKDYQVNFEGDQVVGQFLTQVAGKDVWVTVKGHLGSKDGYATFEPSEFKIGDFKVPVSLVNDQLQKKLLEQRDRLKLPDSVGSLKVENGEVVLSDK